MDYGVETIKQQRPLNSRPGLRVAVWQQGPEVTCARSVAYCTPALSVIESAAAAAVCGLWL